MFSTLQDLKRNLEQNEEKSADVIELLSTGLKVALNLTILVRGIGFKLKIYPRLD